MKRDMAELGIKHDLLIAQGHLEEAKMLRDRIDRIVRLRTKGRIHRGSKGCLACGCTLAKVCGCGAKEGASDAFPGRKRSKNR